MRRTHSALICWRTSQHADYPGVVPYSTSRQLFLGPPNGHEPTPEERTVRGTLVKGLNQKDIDLLDIFEGDVRTQYYQ